MKRTKKNSIGSDLPRPDALLTSDWHLRTDTPLCRTDEEFQKAQWDKVDFIKALQVQYECPVLHAGDLFNHWKPSPWLLSKTMQHLPEQFYTIYGNHDLPQHNIEEQDKCGIFALETAGKLTVLDGVHWGAKPEGPSYIVDRFDGKVYEGLNHTNRKILLYHIMTYQGKTPYPGCKDPKAGGLLRKYPDYDLILTGHNHKAFVETHEERLLVNPGPITRQAADQIDFAPRVYLYYADENIVKPIFLPIENNAVSRSHLERNEERDDRIESFISKLSGEFKAGLDFEENLEHFFKKNKVTPKEKDIIYKALEV